MDVSSAVLGLADVAIKFGVSAVVDQAFKKESLLAEALKYLVTAAAVAIFTKMSDSASEAATSWPAGRNVALQPSAVLVPIPVHV